MLRALLFLLLFTLALRADPILHRGMNLGNALETPREGAWGVVLQAEYFSIIHNAGFDTVRVPIIWVAHVGPAPDYVVDPKFFERIDWVVAQAKLNHLNVILDSHNDDGLIKDPDAFGARFVAIWKQVAEHYRNEPDSILFEPFNEPHDKLDGTHWNALLARALAVIRPANPNRTVVIGPVHWNNFDKLPELRLPEKDRHILVAIHYYLPMQFTHQGAAWIGPETRKWLGTKWDGTEAQQAVMTHDLGLATAWAKAHHRPLLMGEFGSYSMGAMASRARWTTCCARTAESLGIGWCYWEFCSSFGAYDPNAHQWRRPLLQALMPGATQVL